MQKRMFHISFCIVLLISMDCFASGTYQVGQDQGGIYFQTDNDGGWYIGKSDLKDFKIGQTGTYIIGNDRVGTYLTTNTGLKFYLDTKKQAIDQKKAADQPPNDNKIRKHPKTSGGYAGIGGGHFIKDKLRNGELIVLEDRSVWKMDPIDKTISRLWLRLSEIIVKESSGGLAGYDYVLINTDDGEKAFARYVGQL